MNYTLPAEQRDPWQGRPRDLLAPGDASANVLGGGHSAATTPTKATEAHRARAGVRARALARLAELRKG